MGEEVDTDDEIQTAAWIATFARDHGITSIFREPTSKTPLRAVDEVDSSILAVNVEVSSFHDVVSAPLHVRDSPLLSRRRGKKEPPVGSDEHFRAKSFIAPVIRSKLINSLYLRP
jgi:hypothetical protein